MSVVRLVVALCLGLVFSISGYRTRVLSVSGAVAGGIFAFSLVLVGDLQWILPGLTFFVLSSALSGLGRERKRAARLLEEKGTRRDAMQVVSNGGIAWILLLMHAAWPSDAIYVAYLGAFAAAAADTWATELGLLDSRPPRLITTFERVPSGTSGGISSTGIAAALAGATVIWLAASPVSGALPAPTGWIVAGSGVAASLFDSLLGATVQERFMNNDTVNLAATTAGAAAAYACFRLVVFAS